MKYVSRRVDIAVPLHTSCVFLKQPTKSTYLIGKSKSTL